MSLPEKMAWRWQARAQPLVPHAAVAWGQAAFRLHARLCELPEEQYSRFFLTAGQKALVLCGDVADLPWVDGIAYAAPCADAPTLWLPTVNEPDVPADILAHALQRRYPRRPMLLWHEPAAIVPLDRQLVLSKALLQDIAVRWQGGPR